MNRNSFTLILVVLVSLLLIGVFTLAVPKKEPEKKGPAMVTVNFDFNGQGQGNSNSTQLWILNTHWGGPSDDWGSEYIVTCVKHNEDEDWSISMRLDNGTVYDALEKASNVINFTFKSDWYPNFQSHRVTEIAGVADGTDGHYWQYYVNGQYLDKGADLVALSDGDTVRWEFRSALQ